MTAPTTAEETFAERLAKAWGVERLDAAIERLDAAITAAAQQLAPPMAGEQAVFLDQAAESVLNADEPPTDLGDRFHAILQRREAIDRQRQVLTAIRQHLVDRRPTERRRNAGKVIDLLRAEHDDIIKRGRIAFRKLGPSTDAGKAVPAGRADEWHAAAQLADTYWEIRREQITAMAVARARHTGGLAGVDIDEETKQLCATVGTMRDYGDTWRTPPNIRRVDGMVLTETDDTSPKPWLNADRMAAFRWVVNHADSVWLPTPTELDEAGRQRRIERDAARVKVTVKDYPYADMSSPAVKRDLAIMRENAAIRAINEAPSKRFPGGVDNAW